MQRLSECVGFNVPLDTSLPSQSIALTTKNNQTQHYIHQKHKRETEKTALANKTIYTLICLLRPPVRKRSGPYSYSPGAHTGQKIAVADMKNLNPDLARYAFYDLQPQNIADLILTTPEPARG